MPKNDYHLRLRHHFRRTRPKLSRLCHLFWVFLFTYGMLTFRDLSVMDCSNWSLQRQQDEWQIQLCCHVCVTYTWLCSSNHSMPKHTSSNCVRAKAAFHAWVDGPVRLCPIGIHDSPRIKLIWITGTFVHFWKNTPAQIIWYNVVSFVLFLFFLFQLCYWSNYCLSKQC